MRLSQLVAPDPTLHLTCGSLYDDSTRLSGVGALFPSFLEGRKHSGAFPISPASSRASSGLSCHRGDDGRTSAVTLRMTAFHSRTAALGAAFVEYAMSEFPSQYAADILDEIGYTDEGEEGFRR